MTLAIFNPATGNCGDETHLEKRIDMKNKIQSMQYLLGLVTVLSGVAVPQIARAGHTNVILTTELDGSAEVASDPSMVVGDATGYGEAYVFGIDGDPTTLCYVLEVAGIQQVPVGSGMAAHIHEGAAGENGPVVAALAGPEDGNAGDCLTEGEEGKFPTGEAGIVQRILNNPAEFYINVHNPQFPDGAIRGQLAGHHH